jgi:ribosomal protein S18 acetylase RimI-like enzyme
MNFLYRAVSLDDEEQLKNLSLIAYGQYKEEMTEENWQLLRANLTSEDLFPSLLKKAHGFVCERNQKIIGMAFLVPHGNPTEAFDEDWSYLRMVGVDPEFSGQGIGKQLTKRCLDFASHSGEKIVALHTSEAMVAARHIYESFGFSVVKELPPHYGMKYWLYKLEL